MAIIVLHWDKVIFALLGIMLKCILVDLSWPCSDFIIFSIFFVVVWLLCPHIILYSNLSSVSSFTGRHHKNCPYSPVLQRGVSIYTTRCNVVKMITYNIWITPASQQVSRPSGWRSPFLISVFDSPPPNESTKIAAFFCRLFLWLHNWIRILMLSS